MPGKDMPIEEKIRIVEEFQSGEKSAAQASKEAGIGETTLRRWASQYKAEGEDGLQRVQGKRWYSDELKLAAAQDYLRGGETLNEIRQRYKIRTNRQIQSWAKTYQEYGEIRGKVRKWTGGSGNMKKSRKVSHEERVAIAKECIADGNTYGAMAVKYQVAYGQVREWVMKYQAGGEEALRDHRGLNQHTNPKCATHIPAVIIITRLAKKYKVNRALLWGILEDEYNIKKGSGYVMTPLEIQEFKCSVASAVEKAQTRRPE